MNEHLREVFTTRRLYKSKFTFTFTNDKSVNKVLIYSFMARIAT